jgi:hypothetical protein
MTQVEIKENLELIKRVLDMKVIPTDPNCLLDKMAMIASVQSLSADTIVFAEKDYNVKLNQVNNSYSSKSSTERKVIFGEAGKYEIYYQSLAERYNKEIHYQIDILRTLISYIKKDFDTLGR